MSNEQQPYVCLEEEGAEMVHVTMDENGELVVNDMVLTRSEALKLAKFIQENFNG